MRTVLVYCPRVLAMTNTFVADQTRGLHRWRPVLVGGERVPVGLPVEDLLAREMAGLSRPSPPRQVLRRATRRVPVLRQTVGAHRPDLIHAHFLTGGFDVVRTLRPLPAPVVVTAHGFDATWYGSPPATYRPNQWLHGALRHHLVRQPIRFIAVSRFIRDALVEFGAREDRVAVHHTGVDTSYFRPPRLGAQRAGVLFVGRLVEKKGVDDLMEAALHLRARGLAPPVDVIGDGPLLDRLRTRARRERLEVQFHGAQGSEDIVRAMQRAAVLCAPSRTATTGDREGFGMVLAEAQATGLPVVATRCGGMVDAVEHGRTGLLVDEGDPVALATALEEILASDDRRAQFGHNARRWVESRFDLQRQMARLEVLYDEWADEWNA